MIERLDHFVLTVRSKEATCEFYQRVLRFRRVDTVGRPTALIFGRQKINVHQVNRTFEPKAALPTPGAGDFCFVTQWQIEVVQAHLQACDVAIELGPVERDGTEGNDVGLFSRP